MANRAYIIPRRNDINGMGIQVLDLSPNSSQRNLIYDGAGQSHALKWSYDQPGLTSIISGVYSSGSLTTSPLTAMSADVDTNSAGGVDSRVVAATNYGLIAYLREHVNLDPGTTNTILTSAQAVAMAAAITALVDAGSNVDAAALNAAAATATVLVGASDFDGTVVGSSLSFGAVEDVLRLLSGETYVLPINTILCANGAGQVFKTAAQRTSLVAAAVAAGNTQYVAAGHFLAAGEPGYRSLKHVILSGDVRASAGAGQLSKLKGGVQFQNPNFDYSASTIAPDAKSISGSAVSTVVSGAAVYGLYPVVTVYDNAGAAL